VLSRFTGARRRRRTSGDDKDEGGGGAPGNGEDEGEAAYCDSEGDEVEAEAAVMMRGRCMRRCRRVREREATTREPDWEPCRAASTYPGWTPLQVL
jgi:hypothetical protein